MFRKIANEPSYILGDVITANLTARNIRYAEFQSSLNYCRTCLLDFCLSYQNLLANLPLRSETEGVFLQLLRMANDGLESSLDFIRKSILYFFAGWTVKEIKYIQKCFSDCPMLRLPSFDSWPGSLQKVGRSITESLDEAENSMYSLETEIRKGKLEILNMLEFVKNLTVSLEKLKE